MATVTGLTAERMQEIIDSTIVDADIIANHLILTKEDGGTIDAGELPGGAGGGIEKVTAFPTDPAPTDGDMVVRIDQPGDPIYEYVDGVWENIKGQAFACRIRRTTAQLLATSTATAVIFDSANSVEDYDPSGMHDPAGANPTRIVIPADGIYYFKGTIRFATGGTGHRVAFIRKNGSGATDVSYNRKTAEPVGGAYVSTEGEAFLVAGDYLELFAEHSQGSNLNIEGEDLYSIVFNVRRVESGDSSPMVESWHVVGAGGEPAFQNAWNNHLSATWGDLSFRKDRGRLQMKGMINGGSSPTAIIFQLPVGYRPIKRRRVPVYSGSPAAGAVPYVEIDVTGDVYFGGMSAVGATTVDCNIALD